MEATYRVRRFCFDETNPAHGLIVKTGLTLEEAQAHCKDPETRGGDADEGTTWFDGYEEES